MNKEFLEEARLVDLDDASLKELLGFTYNEIKNLDEEQKNDEEIKNMMEALRSYRDSRYNDRKKSLKAQLKAARALAKVRGISWTPPTEGKQ